MMGDDWLNNASTRAAFGRYLEGQLGREIERHIDRVRMAAHGRDLEYRPKVMFGEPDECLVEQAALADAELVVIGSRRPRGVEGLRSRLRVERLVGKLRAPLLVVPHP